MKFGINIGDAFSSCTTISREPMVPIEDELDWEIAWGSPRITKEYIQSLKKMGFGIIKLPVTWKDHFIDGHVSVKWLNRIKEVVDWCFEEDLEVIINAHHDEEWLSERCKFRGFNSETFRQIWKDVATFFKDYDHRLVFEAMNEVGFESVVDGITDSRQEDYNKLFRLNQIFMYAVRTAGGYNKTRKIIYCGMYTHPPLVLDGAYSSYPFDINYETSVHLYFGEFSLDPNFKPPENSNYYESMATYFYNIFKKTKYRKFKISFTEIGITPFRSEADLIWYISLLFSLAKEYDCDIMLWDDGKFIDRTHNGCVFVNLKEIIRKVNSQPFDIKNFIG